jgi:hypothetical protein
MVIYGEDECDAVRRMVKQSTRRGHAPVIFAHYKSDMTSSVIELGQSLWETGDCLNCGTLLDGSGRLVATTEHFLLEKDPPSSIVPSGDKPRADADTMKKRNIV